MSQKPPSNRSFGLLFTVVFGVLAYLLRRKHPAFTNTAIGLSAACLLMALVVPKWLAPFLNVWMRFAELLHRVTSPVILGVLFFIVFTPAALVMKIIKRDAMTRRFDASLGSYWNVRTPPGPAPASLRDQF